MSTTWTGPRTTTASFRLLLLVFAFGTACSDPSSNSEVPGGGSFEMKSGAATKPDLSAPVATSALPRAKCRPDGACVLLARTGPSSVQNPAFSPDGRSMLFTRFRAGYNEGAADIAVLPLAGGAARDIVADGAQNVNLPGSSWNANGSIVYSSDVSGPDSPFLVHPDGSNAAMVSLGPGDRSFEPTLSPDGRRIVYESTPTDAVHRVSVISTDGTGKTQLTAGPNDRQPNWSPRGDLLLFQRGLGGDNWAILTLKPDGSDPTRITPENQSATDASFSADGRFIVYSASVEGEDNTGLWIVQVNGAGARRLTRSAPYDGAPSFSADGSFVAFESTMGADESPTDIMWIAVDAPP
jgi:TolB protein